MAHDQDFSEIEPTALPGAQARIDLVRRVYGNPLQLRREFALVVVDREDDPPLAQIVGSGRGAGTRLRLYLSLLLVGRAGRHEIDLPARAWAEVLGLADVEGKGARSIRSSLDWLASRDLVTLTPRPGAPTTIKLREETGAHRPYQVPGAAAKVSKDAERSVANRHQYVKVPAELWTQGWIVGLSVPALAVLIALLVEIGPGDGTAVTLPESTAKNRYRFTSDTLYRGVRDLQKHGVIHRVRREVGSSLDFRRRHNVYSVFLPQLNEPWRDLRNSPTLTPNSTGYQPTR